MLGAMKSYRSAFIPWRYSTNHHWFYLSWGCRFSKWAYSLQLPVKPIFPNAYPSPPASALPNTSPLWPTAPHLFNSGVRALSSRSLFTLGRRSKQRDWSYIASWYCSRASLSIGRAGECIDRVSWRGREWNRARFFASVCVAVAGFLCAAECR